MKITKALAAQVQLPIGSATAFQAWAEDAGNWSGQPYTGQGNVNFGKATGGYVAKLVAAGYVVSHGEGTEDASITFTDAGIAAAAILGVDLGYLRTEAAPAVKICTKDSTHGAHRVTKSGSYCWSCDRIVAERQKAERAAAKAASA